MEKTDVRKVDAEMSAGRPRILVVDDTESVLLTLKMVLEQNDFEVVTAANVSDALQLITSQSFDVLLSDLHMPNAGDGLTLVSAMRHSNPKAITMIFSGYPEMKEAAAAILLQADEILVKPMDPAMLVKTIRERLKRGTNRMRSVENVADILEKEAQSTIENWLSRIELEPQVITVALNSEERSAHLPQMFRDLVSRLRHPLPLGTRALVSPSADEHGFSRRHDGRRVAHAASQHLSDTAKQPAQGGLQSAIGRRDGDCR